MTGGYEFAGAGIPPDPRPSDYEMIIQALKYTAQVATDRGMPDVADQYLLVFVRLISGDLELQPKRLVR